MSDNSRAAEQMRADLRYADHYRERASALDSLGGLLNCETPGTVSEVTVKRSRWERASKLRGQADDIETRLAGGERS